MEQLQYDQQHGKVKTVKANFVENLTDQYFKKEYGGHHIPAHEQHLYHLAMEARTFDTGTGEKLSRSRVVVLTQENYASMKETHGFAGETVAILHNPKHDSKAAHKAVKAAAEAAKKAAEAASEAEKQRLAEEAAKEAAAQQGKGVKESPGK